EDEPLLAAQRGGEAGAQTAVGPEDIRAAVHEIHIGNIEAPRYVPGSRIDFLAAAEDGRPQDADETAWRSPLHYRDNLRLIDKEAVARVGAERSGGRIDGAKGQGAPFG